MEVWTLSKYYIYKILEALVTLKQPTKN